MIIKELISLVLFAFVLSITPGPNNIMLMASGANYGFRRSIGHILGVGLGLLAMMFILGIGLMQVLVRFSIFEIVLQIVSLLYLFYLTWKIAVAEPPDSKPVDNNPISFLQAVFFQWVNPKAWIMAMASLSLFAPTRSLETVALVSFIFAIVHIPCITVWNVLGSALSRLMTGRSQRRIFNGAMAAMLMISLLPLILSMNAFTLN